MADTSVLTLEDLTASAARVAFVREFAIRQARIVHRTVGRSDDLDVDLLFLAQESVLVFEETHRLVTATAAGKDVASLALPSQLTEQLRLLKAARTSRFKRALIMMLSLTTALAVFGLLTKLPVAASSAVLREFSGISVFR